MNTPKLLATVGQHLTSRNGIPISRAMIKNITLDDGQLTILEDSYKAYRFTYKNKCLLIVHEKV